MKTYYELECDGPMRGHRGGDEPCHGGYGYTTIDNCWRRPGPDVDPPDRVLWRQRQSHIGVYVWLDGARPCAIRFSGGGICYE